MADVEVMSDAELRKNLLEYGYPAGPVTDSTRNILKKKLRDLMSGTGSKNKKSLAAFSSGEDDDFQEGNKKRGSQSRSNKRKTMANLPPPPSPTVSETSSNRRRTLGPVKVGRTVMSYGGDDSHVRSTPPKRQPANVNDYETGSDTDDTKTVPKTTPRKPSPKIVSEKVSTIRKSFTTSAMSTPRPQEEPSSTTSSYRLFSNFRQEATLNQPSTDGQLFQSKFARTLGMSTTPRSYNGNFSTTTVPSNMTRYSRPEPAPQQRPHPQTASVGHERFGWQTTSHLSMLLVAIFVIFFAYLAYQYTSMAPVDTKVEPAITYESHPDNIFPICKSNQMPGVNCVLPSDAKEAMMWLNRIQPHLEKQGVSGVCDISGKKDLAEGEMPRGAMSFKTMSSILELLGDQDPENTMGNIRVLVRHNPHWGYTLLQDGLMVTVPRISWMCWMKLQLALVLYNAFILICIVGVVGAIFWAYRYHKKQEEMMERKIVAMAHRIIDAVTYQRHLDETNNPNHTNETVVDIRSIQDELIPPQDRKRMTYLWDEAVKEVPELSKFIFTDVRQVAGQETLVFIWAQVPNKDGSSPKVASLPSPTRQRMTSSLDDSIAGPSSPQPMETPKQHRLRVWQGQAFETMEGSVNSLPYSPTPCLKIRHMFDPDMARDPGNDFAWPERIKDAILEKCGEGVNILHVSVDKHSTEGCVFVKCASPADAGRAYRALHGSWYDGNLVTVKYLRMERYLERFPDSMNSCIPLRPSNNEKLSLQAHTWQSSLERT